MRYYALKIRVEERDSTRFPNKSKWDEEHRNFFLRTKWGRRL